jgi:tripartite-type tricarboxylate transporter receptor subunit TctC
VPGFAIDNWYGFVFPAGTPKPIVTHVHREMNRILALPELKDRLSPLGIVHFPTATPEEFGAYIQSEMKKYAELVKAAGIVAD